MSAAQTNYKNKLRVSILVVFALATSTLPFINRDQSTQISYVDSQSQEIIFWQNMINKFPTYKDSYIRLSKIEEDQGHTDLAKKLITEAEKLDPYSSEVLKQQAVLGIQTQR